VRLLLDTHVALWAVADSPRLSATARGMIADRGNDIFVSAATIWEIAIKHALARGRPNDMPIAAGNALQSFVAAGYGMLSITPSHAAAIQSLPPLHTDPFDRILLAQALSEPLRLLTRDTKILAYGGTTIEV
jgi:PIN domain nuclease of toxin-antitoxin system